MSDSMTYAEAGVDIDRANKLVGVIKDIARHTPRQGVLGDIGGFGGLFSLSLEDCKRPVLVSSTDGVGTKLKIAFLTRRHDTVGIDLVAMCVNDVLVQGAKPLFFLDYLAMGRLDESIVPEIIKGIGEGCRQAGCALIGGETAEMPGIYQEGEYDLAGFAVGIVDNDRIIDGSEIRVGDQIVGIGSSGLHSNGYSLVRKICFDKLKLTVDTQVPELGQTLGEALMTPTRIYTKTLQSLQKKFSIHGLAHITGGGLTENIVRVIPQACALNLRRGSWHTPAVFQFLQKAGNVSEAEMFRTFNNGIGMAAVVPAAEAADVLDHLRDLNESAWIIGAIEERKGSGTQVKWTS